MAEGVKKLEKFFLIFSIFLSQILDECDKKKWKLWCGAGGRHIFRFSISTLTTKKKKIIIKDDDYHPVHIYDFFPRCSLVFSP